ncbi:heavy-metal-associated domain-containing protein [Ectobacillus funiculus]
MADTTIYVKEATNEQPIQTLETILIQMDGIEWTDVNMEDGEVKITYNENQVTEEQIIKNSAIRTASPVIRKKCLKSVVKKTRRIGEFSLPILCNTLHKLISPRRCQRLFR